MKVIIMTAVVLFFFVNSTLVKKSIAPSKSFHSAYDMIAEGQSLVKEGDVVVRLNRCQSSRFIKNFSRVDKRYSHSGIVLFENGYPYVYHILDGSENPNGKLRKDSLIRFCNPKYNSEFGIYRYDMNEGEINALRSVVHRWYQDGVRFDAAYDLSTDDKMYCSEMVSKALRRSTNNRISIRAIGLSKVEAGAMALFCHLPLEYTSHLELVPIDALYCHPLCHVVRNYDYSVR